MHEQARAQNIDEVAKVTVASCSCVHAATCSYMFPMLLLAWRMAGWMFELKSRFVPKDVILILMAHFIDILLENM